MNRYRLNDEWRNARVAERYKLEEREILDHLAEYGLTPDTMRENQKMSNLMKGYTTTSAIIHKTIYCERKEVEEACIQAIRSGDRIELKALHSDFDTHISSFQLIAPEYNSTLDIVTSNIPFGTTHVFDKAFDRSEGPVQRQALDAVHNYFF